MLNGKRMFKRIDLDKLVNSKINMELNTAKKK